MLVTMYLSTEYKGKIKLRDQKVNIKIAHHFELHELN